jgi:CAAX prenyl protease-like protein
MKRWREDPVIARCAPFAAFIVMLTLASVLSISGTAVFRNLIVLAMLVWLWRSYSELRNAAPLAAPQWLLAIVVGVAIFVLWINLDQDWALLSRPSGGFDPRQEDGSMNWPLALARLAGFALVVPVMEELFWRSFLLRWLARQDFLAVAPREAGARAFLITTVLFALEHNQWLAGAIAGAGYNWVYMRTGNLWVAVLAHAVTNGVLGAWILYTGNWQFW